MDLILSILLSTMGATIMLISQLLDDSKFKNILFYGSAIIGTIGAMGLFAQ